MRDGMWSSSAPNLHNFSATKYPESRRGFNKDNTVCTVENTELLFRDGVRYWHGS